MLANLDAFANILIMEHVYLKQRQLRLTNPENGTILYRTIILSNLQHYMAVTDCKGAYIAVLIGGNTLRWKFIERGEELISMLYM